MPAGTQRGGRAPQDPHPVQRHLGLEERRGDQLRRARLRLPGATVCRGEGRAVEPARGGLSPGAANGGFGDVQAARLSTLLGQPQQVPALPAAKVDRGAGSKRAHHLRERGVGPS